MALTPFRLAVWPVLPEDVADQADMAFGGELRAVGGDDAGGLLAAVLQRVQAERGQRRRVLVAEDAEDAAFLVQLVVEGCAHCDCDPSSPVVWMSLSSG